MHYEIELNIECARIRHMAFRDRVDVLVFKSDRPLELFVSVKTVNQQIILICKNQNKMVGKQVEQL